MQRGFLFLLSGELPKWEHSSTAAGITLNQTTSRKQGCWNKIILSLVKCEFQIRNEYIFQYKYVLYGASLIAQTVKNLPSMRETWVRSLGQEDPWRREWLSTPSYFPGKSHGQRSLVGYRPWGHKELDMMELLTPYTPCLR